ncbi:MAG: aminopeptidase P family protein [Chloroflexi bacterium]|nr:aminopeptidase P family protein [Chloroflexota bacterium]
MDQNTGVAQSRSGTTVGDRVPRLSLAERDRRWALIRRQMDDRGLDCLAIVVIGMWGDMGNAAYISSVYLPGAGGILVIFPRHGEVTVHMAGNLANLEMWRQSQDWVPDILAASQPISWSKTTVDRLREQGLENGRIGVVGAGGALTPEGGSARVLIGRGSELLPTATWEDATDLIENVRLIKSEEEVALLEKAAEIGDRAFEAMAGYAKAGVSSRAVYAHLIHSMLENGSGTPFVLWDAGPSPVHGVWVPDTHILQPGHVVLTEYSPFVRGYEAQFQRALVIGHMPELYGRLFDAALASYERGLEVLKPGNTFGDVSRAMAGPIEAAGFVSITPYYHGLNPNYPISFSPAGRRLAQAQDMARWQEHQTRLEAIPVQPGMLLAFEPNAVTTDQRQGVHVGDPILVTPSGARRLSRTPMHWLII